MYICSQNRASQLNFSRSTSTILDSFNLEELPEIKMHKINSLRSRQRPPSHSDLNKMAGMNWFTGKSAGKISLLDVGKRRRHYGQIKKF